MAVTWSMWFPSGGVVNMVNSEWGMVSSATKTDSHLTALYSLLSPFPSPSQIDLDHPFVIRHLVDRSFRQHGAFVQDRHLDAELAHERHVVLDHHHGTVAIDLLGQLGGLLGLGISHAGDR